MNTIDFGNIDLERDAEHGAWLTLRHPQTNEQTDSRIKLMGIDAPALKPLFTAFVLEKDPDQRSNLLVEIFGKAAIEFDNVGFDGKPVTTENWPMIVSKHRDWLTRQLEPFMINRGNFYMQPKSN